MARYVGGGGGSGGGISVTDATTSVKGVVRLAGDLGGTAAAPTVPALAAKANTAALKNVAFTGLYSDLTGLPGSVMIFAYSNLETARPSLPAGTKAVWYATGRPTNLGTDDVWVLIQAD